MMADDGQVVQSLQLQYLESFLVSGPHVTRCMCGVFTCATFLQDLIKLYAVYNDALINILGKFYIIIQLIHLSENTL